MVIRFRNTLVICIGRGRGRFWMEFFGCVEGGILGTGGVYVFVRWGIEATQVRISTTAMSR